MHSRATWAGYYMHQEANEGNLRVSDYCRGGFRLLVRDQQFRGMCAAEVDKMLKAGKCPESEYDESEDEL